MPQAVIACGSRSLPRRRMAAPPRPFAPRWLGRWTCPRPASRVTVLSGAGAHEKLLHVAGDPALLAARMRALAEPG
jgi:hypothetical protein